MVFDFKGMNMKFNNNKNSMGVDPRRGMVNKQFGTIKTGTDGSVGGEPLKFKQGGGIGAVNEQAARKTVKPAPRGGRILG